MPGSPPIENHRPGNDAAAEDEVEFVEPGLPALRRSVPLTSRSFGATATLPPSASDRAPPMRRDAPPLGGHLGRDDFLDERVPLTARVAAPLPLGVFRAALGAAVDGFCFRHWQKLAVGRVEGHRNELLRKT